VAHVHASNRRACVALAGAHVCVPDMTLTHSKMKCKEKNDTLLPPYVCPLYSYVTNVFVYNLFISVCLYVPVCYSYVLVSYSYVVVCYSYALICYSYVLVCYSYALLLLVCNRMCSYVTRMYSCGV